MTSENQDDDDDAWLEEAIEALLPYPSRSIVKYGPALIQSDTVGISEENGR